MRPDVFHVNALLGFYGKRRGWQKALTLKGDVVGRRATWLALGQRWQTALQLELRLTYTHVG